MKLRHSILFAVTATTIMSCALLTGRTVVFEGTSMLPTIKNGQRLNVQTLDTTAKAKLARGDVLWFKFPQDHSKAYIKRLIALPGDTVETRAGEVWVNAIKLTEPYVSPNMNLSKRSYPAVLVPSRSYYVLGDNRDNSSDSRIWGFVPEELLIAKMVDR